MKKTKDNKLMRSVTLNFMLKNDWIEEATSTKIGRIKWFSPAKGFGFIDCSDFERDVLLHANAVRHFSSEVLLPEADIEFEFELSGQGPRVTKIIAVRLNQTEEEKRFFAEIEAIPPIAARVKWYDCAKGFGFANAFASSEDIFIHSSVLMRIGLDDLRPGDAVNLRTQSTDRGLVAVAIRPWDEAIVG